MTTSDELSMLSDQISRTDLLLGRRGAVQSLTETSDWFDQRPVRVHMDRQSATSRAGQSALLTLVTLLHRAGFPVFFDEAPDATIGVGPFRSQKLAAVAADLGAVTGQVSDAQSAGLRTVLIGDVADVPTRSIQLTWDGWIAAVRTGGTRLDERDGCALAPLLAAALTVSEIFESHLGVNDACWRDVSVSLWNPTSGSPQSQGPALSWLPQQWMLVGLGHLGQANAWCIAHLPYMEDACEIWLADDERVTASNVSTGVLTNYDHLLHTDTKPPRKTRLVAQAVERAGIQTRLIERRVNLKERYHKDLPPIALVGVDNLATRRAISDFGWPLCIDAGLGSTQSSFDSFSIHTFDSASRASTEIESWQEQILREPNTSAPIFNHLRAAGLDECGIVTLANKNVACAYVGMVAACTAVAEVLRRLNGGNGATTISAALDAVVIRGDSITPELPRIPLSKAAVLEPINR